MARPGDRRGRGEAWSARRGTSRSRRRGDRRHLHADLRARRGRSGRPGAPRRPSLGHPAGRLRRPHRERLADPALHRPRGALQVRSGAGYRPEPGELRFDMFEAEYTHEGDRCTFETLLARFGLARSGPRRHRRDRARHRLKDEKFARPETPGSSARARHRATCPDEDPERLDRGGACSTVLYESLRDAVTACRCGTWVALLPAARHVRLRRADRARRLHAARSRRAARLDHRGGLQGGAGAGAARARPARGAARDLPRLGPRGGARRDAGRRRLHPAVVRHGARARRWATCASAACPGCRRVSTASARRSSRSSRGARSSWRS